MGIQLAGLKLIFTWFHPSLFFYNLPRMGLAAYKKKRDFRKTTEPKGKKNTGGAVGKKRLKKTGKLVFVVHKHAATRLHYDLRLEMEGVLKSWAVPKGPSMNPDEKHLAVMVEDHPYEYKDFEGTIPEGEYGAGKVIIWDRGTYSPAHPEEDLSEEEQLLSGLKKGHLSFILRGKKLKGEFSLVEMKGRGKNNWLLMKKKDDFASKEDILKKSRSVKSKKTL